MGKLPLVNIVKKSDKLECVSLVLKVKFWLPPSGFSLSPTAIASITVDLPTPFFPIKNVTGLLNLNSFKLFIRGILKDHYYNMSKHSIHFLKIVHKYHFL